MPRKKKSESRPEFTECPICKRDRKSREFEGHHVVPRSQGGRDDDKNILHICQTCHAIITRGCSEDMGPRFFACFYHQLGRYGLGFLLNSGLLLSNDEFWGTPFVEKWTHLSAEQLDYELKKGGWDQYFDLVDKIKQQEYYIALPLTVKWGPPEQLMAIHTRPY